MKILQPLMPSKEMVIAFINQRQEHVDTVINFSKKLVLGGCDRKLLAICQSHDKSKLEPDEYIPYVWETAPQFDIDIPHSMLIQIEKAKQRHVLNNKHHVDYWVSRKKPMPNIYIAEMCCDLMAVGSKLGNSGFDYYKKNYEHLFRGKKRKVFRRFFALEYK